MYKYAIANLANELLWFIVNMLRTVQFLQSRTFFFEDHKKPGDRRHIRGFFLICTLCERHFREFLNVLNLVLGLNLKVFSQKMADLYKFPQEQWISSF